MTEEATPREVGSNDQLGAGPEALYCYSTNEEEYYGAFNSREEALAEATAELEGYDEPGETRKVWTGVQKPAMHFLRKSTEHLGRDFAERIEEWLVDNIAAEEEIVEVKDYAALGAALLDVGITRTDAGLLGDIDPACREVAGWLAPMPGGTGPMTRAMLLANVVDRAEILAS